MRLSPRILAPALLVGFALAGLAACAHYHLGAAGPLPFHTLYVSVAKNRSFAPQAQAPVTEMLRQSLLQEGNLQLTEQADADATLDVVLTKYEQLAAATQQGNSLNAQSYTFTLTANCTLVDNRSGKVYFKNRAIDATEVAYVQGGDSLSEAEYETMPELARDLAQEIKNEVVDTW
jgi:hypothetical protein